MSTGTSQCFKCGEVCDEETLCSCISADKDKTEADPLARWRTIRLTGADILEDMNSLPVDVSKIEFVQATDFDRLAARVKTLEAALRDCRHELMTSTNFDIDGGIENLEICEPERQRYESLLKMMLKIDQILKGEDS